MQGPLSFSAENGIVFKVETAWWELLADLKQYGQDDKCRFIFLGRDRESEGGREEVEKWFPWHWVLFSKMVAMGHSLLGSATSL